MQVIFRIRTRDFMRELPPIKSFELCFYSHTTLEREMIYVAAEPRQGCSLQAVNVYGEMDIFSIRCQHSLLSQRRALSLPWCLDSVLDMALLLTTIRCPLGLYSLHMHSMTDSILGSHSSPWSSLWVLCALLRHPCACTSNWQWHLELTLSLSLNTRSILPRQKTAYMSGNLYFPRAALSKWFPGMHERKYVWVGVKD